MSSTFSIQNKRGPVEQTRTSSIHAPKRRAVLIGAAAGAAATLIAPRFAAAAAPMASRKSYPAKAFMQTSEAPALQALFGSSSLDSTMQVRLTAPDIAENGAVVPVSIDANLDKITRIALLAKDNPFKLACAYDIPAGTNPTISSRIKLAKTTDVIGVVQSGQGLKSAKREVKVTLGGCG